MNSQIQSVPQYISEFPEEIQTILYNIRNIITSIAPNAIENISYGMPAYKTNNKPLVYFAAYKTHIGLYATPITHSKFTEELKPYKQGKGSVQFPLNQPLPYELIKAMVLFKYNEINNM